MTRRFSMALGLAVVVTLWLIGRALADGPPLARPTDDPPILRTTHGVRFVRTPDARFENLPGFAYQARYIEIDGLRQAYFEEGPGDADPILLLHGQPSWSYLYRKMIPVLAARGHRVIAMDHLGMGRSDKPIDIKFYSYLGHVDRLEKFISALKLEHITLFCQDWGSLIGLHVAGEHTEWFERIVVANGTLPVIPAGLHPFPVVKDPDQHDDRIKFPFAGIPPRQPRFYDDEGNLLTPGHLRETFADWMAYAMKSPSFHPAEVLEALTYFDLSPEEEAAYDAPFPSPITMAGPRSFPSLVTELPGANARAWVGLTRFDKPFLTIWGGNDPGNLGRKETQERLLKNVIGSRGQPHARLAEASHFLQEDQGDEIAVRVDRFIKKNPR